MLYLCIKIFFARIFDVSISTFRTMILLKGRNCLSTILAFFEVLIWFLVAKEALQTDVTSIWIPISYAAGYATGSLIGSYVSKKLIKGICGVNVITDKDNKSLINAIKKQGFGISIIELKKEKNIPRKEMYFIEVNSKSVKDLERIIKKYDEKAFIIVSDTKFVNNGFIK